MHSFGLPLAEERKPFHGLANLERISERFSLAGCDGSTFAVRPLGDEINRDSDSFEHSPLGFHGLTTQESLQATYFRPGEDVLLPEAFAWACGGCPPTGDDYEEPQLVFSDRFDDGRCASLNDFIVSREVRPELREPISQTLLELMAHQRSRLFGFPLANRFVNVMLPHATLRPCESTGGHVTGADGWFLQPMVSFIRGGRDRNRRRLRKTYSLTFFLIPIVASGGRFKLRRMTACEISAMVNAGWGFAAAPKHDAIPRFAITEDQILCYLSKLARFDLYAMRRQPYASGDERIDAVSQLTLRQAVERIAFGVDLSIAQGKAGETNQTITHRIGNDVVMTLGSARVSAVVAVDRWLETEEIGKSARENPFPGSLLPLMARLARPMRMPGRYDSGGRRYRLDRPFVDGDAYAVGVIPTKRCLVVASRDGAQYGVRESALTQAGSVAYMTLGAAAAIGTMREIDRRLEQLEGLGDPTKIAEVDREIAGDLGEIYDLDITRDPYREFYRRLRDRLGIARDYKTLQDKMKTLYRATSTFHERKTEQRLVWLTAAIVVLSVFILIGTIVLIGNGG